jgi:radical SAM-linked protein
MYEVSYDRDGRLRSVTPLEGARDRITRRIVSDLDSAYFPIRPVVPYIETVFDRVMLEIFRGCTRGCRFCQAGMIYRPVRERNPETLLRLAKESLDATGYEEISLASLSCSDYGRLGEFLRALQRDHSHHYLEVSLPSLRIDAFSVDLACLVAKNRKTTLTFAPEAGTQRLRDFINKGVTEEDLMSTLAAAKKAGWSGIKLYFMFGLPGERPEDLEGIKALARRVVRELKLKLNISLSAFVPKPMTVFQWEAQDIVEKLHEKTGMFRRMGHPHINASFSTPPMSFLEGVLARGDRRMGAVIHRAWLAGARFDGWREHFNPALWLDAFALENIDPAQYVHRERPRDEIFPWDHLMEPGTREFLWRDLERARKGKLTADCRGGACEGCGICVSGGPAVVMTKGGGALEPAADFTRFEAPAVSRVRVSFSKGPQVRFISHLDLMRAVERAIRRAKIPMAYSGGFHPRMRISFGYPLPLGYCSLSEWMDMDTAEPLAAEDLMAALNATLPPGIVLTGARLIPLSEPSLMAAIEQMEYRVYLENDPVEFPGIAAIVEEVTLRDYLPVEKKGKRIDLKNFIEDLKVQSGEPLVVEMRLRAGQGGSVTPREVLRLFEGLEPGLRVLYTERLACRKKESGGWVEP